MKHLQQLHQNQENPSLHWVLGVHQHRTHQGDQQGQSHHGLLLVHPFQQVQRVQGVQRFPENATKILRDKHIQRFKGLFLCVHENSRRGQGVQLYRQVRGNQ